MCCASDNHNYMCHTCAKEFFKFELQLSSYSQNIKFSRYCPKFHIFENIVIFQVHLQLFRKTVLHPYKFHGSEMSGILFFIFVSCHPLHQGAVFLVGLANSQGFPYVWSCLFFFSVFSAPVFSSYFPLLIRPSRTVLTTSHTSTGKDQGTHPNSRFLSL